MKKTSAVILFIFLSCAFVLSDSEKKHFTIDDCFKIKEISDIQTSPDGKKIAFVKKEIIPDPKKKGKQKPKQDIYLLILADNIIHRLTTREEDSFHPRWSYDGRYLYFLSKRTAKTQIWALDIERGGEACQITDWKSEIQSFACSPSSNSIAFVSVDTKKEKDAKGEDDQKKNDPYVITRTSFLYDGKGYFGDPRETWIVGQTDRFAAAVAERFVVDNFSSYGVDDSTLWWEKDLGLPYNEENFQLYRKTSPISYIKNCKTPILLIQCMEDHRCPLPQALQFYMGLKKLKKAETQLVLYPRESPTKYKR